MQLQRWWNEAKKYWAKKEEIFLKAPGGRFRKSAAKQIQRQIITGCRWAADSTFRCTHILSGSCTLAWASSSEVMDATLGGTSTPAEEGEGPG